MKSGIASQIDDDSIEFIFDDGTFAIARWSVDDNEFVGIETDDPKLKEHEDLLLRTASNHFGEAKKPIQWAG